QDLHSLILQHQIDVIDAFSLVVVAHSGTSQQSNTIFEVEWVIHTAYFEQMLGRHQLFLLDVMSSSALHDRQMCTFLFEQYLLFHQRHVEKLPYVRIKVFEFL